ncbi:MAG: DNA-binding protein [Anaerolineae bacterium]
MSTVTITLSDEQYSRLRELAVGLKTTPEELARVGVEDLLARPDEDFDRAAAYVLNKNAELYRRLA